MSNRRTRTFTRRSDAMLSPEYRSRRISELKKLNRSLTNEELEELKRLMSGTDN
jgi:hypothetical protein